jgi:thioredoxin 1
MVESMSRQDFLDKVFNFEKSQEWAYQGKLPCVIDFYDDTCPPCQSLSPVFARLAEEYRGRVSFYKVDTRIDETLAQELGVKSLPTLVFCPLDDKPAVLEGSPPQSELASRIESELLTPRADGVS